MKVLVVTAAYPSAAEPTRAIYLESLHRELLTASRGDLELEVVAPRVHPADPLEEEREGVCVRRFDYGAKGERLKERASFLRLLRYYWRGSRAASRAAARMSPDLVVCHWMIPTGPLAASAARRVRVPLVAYAHGSDVHTYGAGGVGKAHVKRVLSHATKTIAVSRDLRDRLHEIMPEADVSVLPMGVAECFGGNAEPLILEDRCALELLYVGDVSRAKGAGELFAAMESLMRAGVDVRLHIVGARESTYAVADSLPHDRVVWHGSQSQADLARWYRTVDLLVHPSHAEGSPVCLMEALSSGLPVVATSVGGVVDIVEDGVTGQLVRPRDSTELADALSKLASDEEAVEDFRRGIERSPRDDSVLSRACALLEIFREAIESDD